MRRAAALVVVAGLSALAFIPTAPQAPIKSKLDDPLCILIARPENYFTYVPRPEQRRSPSGEVATATATFQVTYVGFTPQAQTAFQAAVDIWSNLVVSAAPIRVTANWTALAPNVLGSAGAHFVNRDFGGAPVASTWYGDALADALHGSDLNAGTADIDANFNSNFANWYFGTDGATPGGQYDFESVVLHELGHGLNFFGLANVSGGSGSLGAVGFPSIYDRFTATETGALLLATFTNPSIALGTQLTQNFIGGNPRGPGVYFNGTNTNAANGAQTARLYTVNPWAPGSSYSHLDESTYPAGNQNSLMTYALGQAEAIHNPGPVSLGIFKDEGWQIATPCSPAVSPTSATIAKAGGGGNVNVTIGGGCGWTAVANNGFIHVTAPGTGTGNGSFAYTVDANGTTPRQGTISVGTATFTVNQVGNTVTMSPGTLYFKGTNTAGVLNPMTGAQTVTVSFIGTGGTTWSVASNQAWAQPTGGIGTNNGQFSVAIVNPGNILNGQTHVTASLTLTATNVGNSPQIATVDLVLVAPGATTVPFGQVDGPAQSATNIQGAIGVSGWVLDDVGVTGVKLYRNCLAPSEPAGNCAGGLIPGDPATQLAFIGDAAFVAGVRPDLEAAFPTTPLNNRAGWGYLMLSNMLPRTTGGFAQYGGQGPLTLYAIATDIEGNRTLLGRVWNIDHNPTNITMANDSIAKPFGAIDFPTQGGTASGAVYGNFGWVLTPDLNTVVDGTDILMPTNGATLFVYVDSVPIANVTYNQCRGNVGNPPAAGVYCNDDVASIFGNSTIQPPLTPRASNPTKYRNLDSGRGPQGSYPLNTTLLTNGLHSIAWSATDSNGRIDGIGSRNFLVLNAGARPIGPEEEEELLKAPAESRGLASSLETMRVSNRPLSVRTGYDPRTTMTEIARGRDSVRAVTIRTMGRVELGFAGRVQGGYLVANGTLRDLPVGSSLDRQTGVFAWIPAIGSLGTYRLAFLVNGERVVVDVTVVVDDPDAAVRQDKRTIK